MGKTTASEKDLLFYGDNLRILREHIPDESVDLVYLDPPFRSGQNYNVLFEEKDGTKAAAQIQAFEDTWRWDQASARTLEEIFEQGGRVADAMHAFKTFLGTSDMMAYLAMMAPRLVELHRVLKDTGSLYLHCDPTASHYLKVVLDAVFGPENFRNEIVWARTVPKGLMTRRLPSNHDIILSYQRGEQASWNLHAAFVPYDLDDLPEKTKAKYSLTDEDGRKYQLTSLLNPNKDRPNLTYEFLGVTRVWRWTKERMEDALRRGLIVQPRPGAVPRFKRYLDEQRGIPLGDVWSDIPPVNAMAQERLGYPTQKPEALLERILEASSNEGDTVLDPFCGCGTTIAVAQRLKRRWIGIDVTHLAINLIKYRLADAFAGSDDAPDFQVVGEPETLPDAEQLAEEDPFGFQSWILGLVDARIVKGKRGADQGIDGRLYFHDEPVGGKTKQIVFSVKAGKTGSAHVRDLRGVVEREEAAIGVLLSLQEPTGPMRKEAAEAGFYESPGWNKKYPRIQLLTAAELLDGRKVDFPRGMNVTFREAPRAKKSSRQKGLFE